MGIKSAIKALLDKSAACKLLIVTAAITWGFSFFIMKDAVAQMPVFWLLTVRFLGSGVILAAIFHRRIKDSFNRRTVLIGLMLGFLGWAAYAFQTVGITLTTPGKNAFLTGCYCVIVPFCAWAAGLGKPERYNVIGAVLCLFGLGLVALDNGLPLNIGDVLTFCGAVFFAMQMALVSKYGPHIDVWTLTMWEFVGMGVTSAVCSMVLEQPPAPSTLTPSNILVLAFLTLICSLACTLAVNHAFSKVDPTAGALLSSLESPSGVLFSILFGREMLTGRLLAGFALIFIAIIFSEAGPTIVSALSSGLGGHRSRR